MSRAFKRTLATSLLAIALAFCRGEGPDKPADDPAAELSGPPKCAAHREYSPEQKKIVDNILTWALLLQGTVKSESKSPNPRPLPNITLSDLADEANIMFNAQGNSSRSIQFVFYKRGFKSQRPEIVAADPAALWCLALPGDVVLLSDGATHHITKVFRVALQEDVIDFIDPWPDDIFLGSGRNTVGVSATLVDYPPGGSAPKKLVRISRTDFLKVLVGTIMTDGADLPEQYFALAPASQTDPKVRMAFAATFLSYPNDLFIHDATQHLEPALSQAERARDRQLATSAAARLHLAHRLARSERIAARQTNDAELLGAKAADLERRYGVEALEAQSTGIDFYRAALAAGRAERLLEAIEFFDKSIARQPAHQDSYLWRAFAFTKLSDHAAAARDAAHALELNRAETEALERRAATNGRVGLIEREQEERRRAHLEQQRKLAAEVITINKRRFK